MKYLNLLGNCLLFLLAFMQLPSDSVTIQSRSKGPYLSTHYYHSSEVPCYPEIGDNENESQDKVSSGRMICLLTNCTSPCLKNLFAGELGKHRPCTRHLFVLHHALLI
jgi:hypothetical protein